MVAAAGRQLDDVVHLQDRLSAVCQIRRLSGAARVLAVTSTPYEDGLARSRTPLEALNRLLRTTGSGFIDRLHGTHQRTVESVVSMLRMRGRRWVGALLGQGPSFAPLMTGPALDKPFLETDRADACLYPRFAEGGASQEQRRSTVTSCCLLGNRGPWLLNRVLVARRQPGRNHVEILSRGLSRGFSETVRPRLVGHRNPGACPHGSGPDGDGLRRDRLAGPAARRLVAARHGVQAVSGGQELLPGELQFSLKPVVAGAAGPPLLEARSGCAHHTFGLRLGFGCLVFRPRGLLVLDSAGQGPFHRSEHSLRPQHVCLRYVEGRLSGRQRGAP